jgi:mannitol-1-phosphate/altronate dehydrogenase
MISMKARIAQTVKLLLVLMAFVFTVTAYGQDKKDEKEAKKNAIQNMVTAQHYAFKAQNAQPLAGANRQLTTEYDVKVTKSDITSFLPYFGRAYSAPINSQGGGIQFSSKSFEYTLTDRKKGGWDVLIKPKDAPEVQQLSLGITEEGYATLQVISTNRQPISFTGYLVEIKEQKK